MNDVVIRPVTPDLREDVTVLFGPRGVYGQCWCMYWRMRGRDFTHSLTTTQTREQFLHLVGSGEEPGLLAYLDGAPAGWCALAPRTRFPRVLHSPKLRPVPPDDPADESVWAVPCFYVSRRHRGSGLSALLLRHAVEHARTRRARAVEGYPKDVDPAERRLAGVDLYTGWRELFAAAGFAEVRRVGGRPIMRLEPAG